MLKLLRGRYWRTSSKKLRNAVITTSTNYAEFWGAKSGHSICIQKALALNVSVFNSFPGDASSSKIFLLTDSTGNPANRDVGGERRK